jgi:tripartite-type tricarboxylate transporter receptor subunit TctC
MYPDVPTLQELGYKEFDREGYFGLAFPAGTPAAAIARIHQATVAVLKTPAMANALKTSGLRGVGSTPAEFDALLRDDLVTQASIIKRLGIVKR